ncbi:MAG: F0F1 ATP synthase subunit B [Clostridiales bacterium]|nr:F0F1 ATP synthase subunit B [Clostridiales bacterium]MBO4580014.1 F0F1 ATP synthase subunit B [Clostridiales bacterium]
MNYELFNIILSAEEESGLFTPDQFAGYAVTAVFTAINLLVAYVIIKKLVYKKILEAMHDRRDALNNELTSAEKANAEATKTAEERDQIIDDAKIQASGIIEEARSNADKQADNIIKNAEDEAAAIIARAEDDAAKLRISSIEGMKDDISDLAVSVAERILGEAVPHENLVAMAGKHTEEVINAEVKQDV